MCIKCIMIGVQFVSYNYCIGAYIYNSKFLSYCWSVCVHLLSSLPCKQELVSSTVKMIPCAWQVEQRLLDFAYIFFLKTKNCPYWLADGKRESTRGAGRLVVILQLGPKSHLNPINQRVELDLGLRSRDLWLNRTRSHFWDWVPMCIECVCSCLLIIYLLLLLQDLVGNPEKGI